MPTSLRKPLFVLLFAALLVLTALLLLTLRGGPTAQANPGPDLTATKTNNTAGSAAVGETFTWTIRVENIGDATSTLSNADNLLRDQLPTGPTYGAPSATPSAGASGTVNCNIAGSPPDLNCLASGSVSIPAGEYFDISFDVTPNAIGTLNNPRGGGICKANPLNDPFDDPTTNNDCSDTVTVLPDLTVTKSDGPDPVAAGAILTFVLSPSNLGTADAIGAVEMDDHLPPGYEVLLIAAGSGWTCNEVTHVAADAFQPATHDAVECSRTDMAIGVAPGVSFTAIAPSTLGTHLNVVVIDPADTIAESNEDADDPLQICGGEESNPPSQEPDNYDCEPNTVVGPDLVLGKAGSSASVPTGGALTYTLTSSNVGSTTASGYFIDDFIPAGVTVTGFTATDFADCDRILPIFGESPPWVGPATIRCGPFTTDAGFVFTDTVTLTTTVTAAPGTILNGALTDSDGDVVELNEDGDDPALVCTGEVGDLAPATEPDNYDCLATTVTVGPDLELVKSASSASVPSGGTVTYTLTSSNVGTATASSYFIDDFIPAGITITAATPTEGDCDQIAPADETPPWTGPATIRCGPFTTPAAGTDTVTLTATVTITSGSVLNGARTDSTGVVTEANEDADDPDLVCTSVGEGTDLGTATEDDNYDCLATTVSLEWGDVDCDGDVDIGDAQKIARDLINLAISQTEPCPDIGSDVEVDSVSRKWGDVDCDGDVDIGDAQKIARDLINLAISQTEPCPDIGDPILLTCGGQCLTASRARTSATTSR